MESDIGHWESESVPVYMTADGSCSSDIFDADGIKPWRITVVWTFRSGTPLPSSMTLEHTGGQPVTAEAWRLVKPAAVLNIARSGLRTWADVLANLLSQSPAAEEAENFRQLTRQQQVKRNASQYSDQHYREVAAVYNAAKASGDTRPRRTVVRHFLDAYPGLDSRTDHRVKAWLRTARERGYIPKEG